jgi:hypothetical protein
MEKYSLTMKIIMAFVAVMFIGILWVILKILMLVVGIFS